MREEDKNTETGEKPTRTISDKKSGVVRPSPPASTTQPEKLERKNTASSLPLSSEQSKQS